MTVSISFPSGSSSAIDLSNYQLKSEKGAIDGYASLDSSGKLIATEIPFGTTANTVAEGSNVVVNSSSTTNIIIDTNGVDFVLQDSSNTVTNYLWRDVAAGKLKIGTADVIPATRRDLETDGGAIYWHSGNDGAGSGLDADLWQGNNIESGTFTPVLRTLNDSTEPTYTTQTGYYTKIGDVVTIQIDLVLSSTISSGSGTVMISGLPFNPEAATFPTSSVRIVGGANAGLAEAYGATNQIRITKSDGVSINHTYFQNGTGLRATMTYIS